jgi:hypothetical protein
VGCAISICYVATLTFDCEPNCASLAIEILTWLDQFLIERANLPQRYLKWPFGLKYENMKHKLQADIKLMIMLMLMVDNFTYHYHAKKSQVPYHLIAVAVFPIEVNLILDLYLCLSIINILIQGETALKKLCGQKQFRRILSS